MPLHIVMPFYGDEKLFREAVESVLAQSTAEWLLTVIDDAYPDPKPGQWLVGLEHPRIRYIRNESNGGVSAVFRQAVELAETDLLTIMGCDDRLRPGYVERAVSQMSSGLATHYQPGVAVVDESGETSLPLADRVKRWMRPRPGLLSGEHAARSLLVGNWTYFPSIVWRTDAVRQHSFDPRFEVVLDLHLQLQLLEAGGAILVDDETVFEYRRHSRSVSSMSAKDGARFAEEDALFAEWAHRCRRLAWPRAERAARSHLTSRLHALTMIPGSAAQPELRRQLLNHVLGRTPRHA
jgi:glycosyltransferase involved in cell wall biosynthesis